jgi:hypothetical protein
MSDSNNKDYKLIQFQRNRYFYGKLMTVRDFDKEQDYMNEKRHLLNRMINGPGVICGLGINDVELSVSDGNVKIRFKTGGAAIDCWGREIVVPVQDKPREVFVKEGETKSNLTTALLDDAPYYLYLEYDPREGEMVSSALENSSCEETCCPNRVIENFEVIASKYAPGTPDTPNTQTIDCPDFTVESPRDETKQKVKNWLQDRTSGLCTAPGEGKVFFLALNQGSYPVSIDVAETDKYLSFVTNNSAFSGILACHLSDFGNPHKSLVGLEAGETKVYNEEGYITIEKSNEITLAPDQNNHKITIGETHSAKKDNPHKTNAAQVGAPVSVDGVSNPGGDIDLVQDNSITITPDDTANTITIGETHSAVTGNPHSTKHAELDQVLPVADSTEPAPDDDVRDKHISNNDAKKWNEAAERPAGGEISGEGGMLTGSLYVKTPDWSAVSGTATKTYGVMGQLTEDIETGSSYRCAGVVGVSEVEGKHGVYAKSPEGTHALYVKGSAHFTGPMNGYTVNTFKNGSDKILETGDVVVLKDTPITRFCGENNKIPVPGVTLAYKDNAGMVVGIVDCKAIPEEDIPDVGSGTDVLTEIAPGEELYVVTHGCYAHCKVAGAAILVGDLLRPTHHTQSLERGFAEKALVPKLGSIIGKALEPWPGTAEEDDYIAVFVNIQ